MRARVCIHVCTPVHMHKEGRRGGEGIEGAVSLMHGRDLARDVLARIEEENTESR